MLLIISWSLFILLTAILIGAVVYVTGLCIGPLFGAPFVPTRANVLDDMVRLSGACQGMRIADLGSGDGRLVAACATRGALVVGYEINPVLIWLSRLLNIRLRPAGSAKYILGNFMNRDLSGYDAIITYLMPPMMVALEKKLLAELKPGARVVSNSFPFPNWKPIIQEGHIYVYEKTLDSTIPKADTRLV